MSTSIILQYIHFQNKRKTCLLEWTGRMWRRRQRVCTTTTTTQDLEEEQEQNTWNGQQYKSAMRTRIEESNWDGSCLSWERDGMMCLIRCVVTWMYDRDPCRRLNRENESETITNNMVLCWAQEEEEEALNECPRLRTYVHVNIIHINRVERNYDLIEIDWSIRRYMCIKYTGPGLRVSCTKDRTRSTRRVLLYVCLFGERSWSASHH